MNIKLNSLIKFFLVLLLLSSCEKDLYENQIKESTLKISHKQFSELLQVDAFNKSLNEVLKITEYQKSKENLALNGKTVMEEDYGFTITGKPINVIENDTITSYTLFVTRDNNPLNVIENLVIQANNNNPSDIKAYLIKYTNDVNIYADFDMKDFQGTKTIVPIEYNVAENNPNNRIVYYDICFDVQSWYCYGSGHHPNSVGCIQGYAITTQECVTLSYNDGASSGGGGSSGGILTGPHGGGGGSPNSPKTPCQQLKDNNSKPIANTSPPKTVLDNLNDLTSQMATNPRERMFVLTPTSTAENQYAENYVEGPLNGGDVELNLSNLYVSILMHCHYKTSLLSIFSLSDIYQVYAIQSAGFMLNDGELFTSYLVTAHGTKYAIKFAPQNLNSLSGYNENFFTGWEFDNMKKAKEDKYAEDVQQTNTPAQNELGFLKFIKDQNLGIEIYKADATFSQWSKLTIGTNGQVKPVPCP